MHPASRPTDLAGDWESDIEAAEGFGEPQVRAYPWRCEYSAADYVALLQTHQDHILLERRQREAVLAAVARVIDNVGGKLEMSFVTPLCLARRA